MAPVPRRRRYYGALRRPAAPLASPRCLRSAIPGVAPALSLPSVPSAGPRARGSLQPVPAAGSWYTRRRPDFPGSWGTHCPFALFSDPGRTGHARPLRRAGMAPAMSTAKAPTKTQLSRLNGTASGLAVYASPGAVTHTRCKTRFRPLARRYRAGLNTRRVPLKGFRVASYASSPFPRLDLAQGQVSVTNGNHAIAGRIRADRGHQ